MKGLETTSYRTPDTPYTQAYWRRLFPNQVPQLKLHEQLKPKKGKPTVTIERQSIPSTIRLTCGCTATVYPDGTTYPHHIKGCDGKDD